VSFPDFLWEMGGRKVGWPEWGGPDLSLLPLAKPKADLITPADSVVETDRKALRTHIIMQIYEKHSSTGLGNDRQCGSNYKAALSQISSEFDGISNHYIGSFSYADLFP
jgi:hypothetical protein